MATKTKRIIITLTGIIFLVVCLVRLAEALRVVSDDNKAKLEEVIKKEDIQKKEIIQKQKEGKERYKEQTSSQSELKGAISRRPPAEELESKNKLDRMSSSTFYILGGIFFVVIIGVATIFIRKIES